MPPLSYPLRFLVLALAGWINQQQREVIDYLQTENRVLHEQLGANGCTSPTISASDWPPKRSACGGECSGKSAPS